MQDTYLFTPYDGNAVLHVVDLPLPPERNAFLVLGALLPTMCTFEWSLQEALWAKLHGDMQ